MSNDKFVTITESDYKQLREDQDKLWALETYGVDNWEGYSDAMQSLKDEE